ncbi:OLC1v1028288C1 [Oldenlandia corymbosa var. corymbosa]|uniref:OLC1v1028288C1 n=1 Tax=Oldenlandia corymbosa var. corymbosa TaxID=529605 RepID=A0AAV1CBF1_OLDCO|nr:OLC1v1028288C1 [Oldenlandia corymbosa var. corymbosa]
MPSCQSSNQCCYIGVGEVQMTNPSTDTPKAAGVPVAGSPFHAFILSFPKQVQKYLKLDFKASKKDYTSTGSAAIDGSKKDSSASALTVNLEKQLQAWKENRNWTDSSPEIKVTVPKGSLCNLSVKVDVGLPPDAVYNIVIDPDNKRVFKNIKEVISRNVLVDEGSRQVVELDQAAIWRFLWWSGTISVHVLVDQDRRDHSMKFKQIKTGFMKRFEGCWRVEPILLDEQLCHPIRPKNVEEYDQCTKGKGRIASRVSLEQLIQPAVVPPPPISWYLRGITTRTTEMIINDLLAETARIRGSSSVEAKTLARSSGKCIHEAKSSYYIKKRWDLSRRNAMSQQCFDEDISSCHDIKERWALRRRNAEHRNKRR